MSIVKVPINGGVKGVIKYPLEVNVSFLMDKRTVGTKYLTELLNVMKPGLTLNPVHSHKNIEEIAYVLEGDGKVWIDGEICDIRQGDSVLFPANSKHSVKNSGKVPLKLLCFFSSSNYREQGKYITHEHIDF
jgi:mannose-6-phosphate isomerase-like protein (cupin superfamily)